MTLEHAIRNVLCVPDSSLIEKMRALRIVIEQHAEGREREQLLAQIDAEMRAMQ